MIATVNGPDGSGKSQIINSLSIPKKLKVLHHHSRPGNIIPKRNSEKMTRFVNRPEKVSKRNLSNKNHNPSPIGTAFKLSTELVSAVAVGTIIGFILDKTFGTKPWLILIFFFVGVVAGIINVIRSAKKMQK